MPGSPVYVSQIAQLPSGPFDAAGADATIHNFYRSESQLGETGYIEPMAASNPPEVRKSYLKVPTGPGLGFEMNPDFLKKNLTAGEEYWG